MRQYAGGSGGSHRTGEKTPVNRIVSRSSSTVSGTLLPTTSPTGSSRALDNTISSSGDASDGAHKEASSSSSLAALMPTFRPRSSSTTPATGGPLAVANRPGAAAPPPASATKGVTSPAASSSRLVPLLAQKTPPLHGLPQGHSVGGMTPPATPHEVQQPSPMLSSPADAPVPQPPSAKRAGASDASELPRLGSVGPVVSILGGSGTSGTTDAASTPAIPKVDQPLSRVPQPNNTTAALSPMVSHIVVTVTIPPGKVDRLNLDQRYLRELPCLQLPVPEPSRVGGTLANAMAATSSASVAASYNPHLVAQAVSHVKLLNLQNNELEHITAPPLAASPPYIPAATPLSCFSSVVYLDLYNNRLQSLTGAEQLKKLRVLMVGKNRLSDLSLLHEQVTPNALEVLDVHGNCLTTFFLSSEESAGGSAPSASKVFPQLRVLNVAGNRLTNLCGIECLPALSEFNARRNRITDLPESMPRHALNLRKCFLSSNQLGVHGWEEARRVVKTITACKHLEEVTLDANPLKPSVPGASAPPPPSAGSTTSPVLPPADGAFLTEEALRLLLVSSLPALRLLDSTPVSDEDRVRAAAQANDAEVTAVVLSGGDEGLNVDGATSARSTPTEGQPPNESLTSPNPPTSPSSVLNATPTVPFALRSGGSGLQRAQVAGRGSFSKPPQQLPRSLDTPTAPPLATFAQFSANTWSIDVQGALAAGGGPHSRRFLLPPCPNAAVCTHIVWNRTTTDVLRHSDLPTTLQQLSAMFGSANSSTLLDLHMTSELATPGPPLTVWDVQNFLRLLARPPRAVALGAMTLDGKSIPKDWTLLLTALPADPSTPISPSSIAVQDSPHAASPTGLPTRAACADDRWLWGGSTGRNGSGPVGGGNTALWGAWRTTRSKPCIQLSAAFGSDVITGAVYVGESMRALDAALVDTHVLTRVLQLCGAESAGGGRGVGGAGSSPTGGNKRAHSPQPQSLSPAGASEEGGRRRSKRLAYEVNPVHQPKAVVVHMPGAGSIFTADLRDDGGSRAKGQRSGGGPARRVHRAVANAGRLHSSHSAGVPKRNGSRRENGAALQPQLSTPTSLSSSALPPRSEELEADVENPDEEEEEEEEEE